MQQLWLHCWQDHSPHTHSKQVQCWRSTARPESTLWETLSRYGRTSIRTAHRFWTSRLRRIWCQSSVDMTKAKLFFEAGLIDYTCPPACVAAGYNVAPSDDKTIVFFPYRPHTTGKMDKRAAQRWRTEIMTPREKWLDDYMK